MIVHKDLPADLFSLINVPGHFSLANAPEAPMLLKLNAPKLLLFFRIVLKDVPSALFSLSTYLKHCH